MSHITPIDLEIKNLDALKLTCKRLGVEWMEDQETYKWYGRFVGDYPLPQGVKIEDLGKCDHAIRVPGASYEIGVLDRDGKITLMWDFWGAGGLEKVLGPGGAKLKQMYAIEEAKLEAERRGYFCLEEVKENGDIELTIEVN